MFSNFSLLGKTINLTLTQSFTGEFYGQGIIEFLSSNVFSIYINWKVYDKDSICICGQSLNMFSPIEERTDASVMAQVIERIKNYRVGREKIFMNIEFTMVSVVSTYRSRSVNIFHNRGKRNRKDR